MRFGSLFSGIGGLDLGLERAGMTCAFQVERDPFCQRVLAKHWPDVPRYGDIQEVKADGLPPIDLLAGGFPCQPHSVAGCRQASADDRDLWSEFARLIQGTRPRWVVAENVPGLLSSEGGVFFGRVLGDLAGLGFDAEWRVLTAAAMGAPHLRRRVFIVAHANGERCEERRNGAGANQPGWLTWGAPQGRGEWENQPSVGRVANGVPRRVDRLRACGNAVVPGVAEYVGRLIVEADPRIRRAG